MNNKYQYLIDILNKYDFHKSSHIHIDKKINGYNNIKLSSTEVLNDSKVGIVIVPGMTVPRESGFKLMASLSEYNVLIYDLRGQADSKGEIDAIDCVKDVNVVGNEFKERRDLEYIIAIGHSFGGMNVLASSAHHKHPYGLRIALAAPVDLKKAARKIPTFFRNILVYMHNYIRSKNMPALKDDIVRYHQKFDWKNFKEDPRIVSMRIGNPKYFNQTLNNTPKLSYLIKNVQKPSYLIYAGNDKRLKINKKNKDDFQKLRFCAKSYNIKIEIIDGLSHRFNYQDKEFILSNDNDLVEKRCKEIIKSHIL